VRAETERAEFKPVPPKRRLTGWKEIGAFFGKNERTVKRWELTRGLPVHRPPGSAKTAVFADVLELEEWLKSGRAEAALEEEPKPIEPATVPLPAAVQPSPRRLGFAAGAIVLLFLLVVGALIGSDTKPVHHRPNGEAQQAYFSGVYHWNTRTADGLKQSLGEFKQAIALDPDYAAAYAGLGNAYNLLAQYDVMKASEAYPLARQAAEQAIALDPALADGYSALGFAMFYGFKDLRRADELFQKALALDPNSGRTFHWYALIMMHTGKFDEPLRAITRAQELDPDSHAIRANRGLILFYAGRAQEAIDLLNDLTLSAPAFLSPHYYLATIYLDQQRYDDYLRETLKAAELEGNAGLKQATEAATAGYRAGGPKGLFSAMLAVQQSELAAGKESAFNVARTAALLGDSATAFAALQQSLAAKEPDLLGLRIDRAFKDLRGDARFQKLAAAVLDLP